MLKDDSTPIIVSSKRVFGGPGNVLGTGFQAVSQTTNPRPQGPPVRVQGFTTKVKEGKLVKTLQNVRSHFKGRGWDFNHLSDTF